MFESRASSGVRESNGRWSQFVDSRNCSFEERQEALRRREERESVENEISELHLGVKAGENFKDYSAVPLELEGPNCPPLITQFSDIDLGDDLHQTLMLVQYKEPTPVQKGAIPVVHQGSDLMACAETGSGKTAAYLLPIISKILKEGSGPEGGGKVHPRALIMAPTRELALQIHEEAQKFGGKTPLRSIPVYGGKNVKDSLWEFDKGCDILVATPGRLADMISHERSRVTLDSVQFLVLDEADRMLDEGFEQAINDIITSSAMPPDRQTLLFSATFPDEIMNMAMSYLKPDKIYLKVGKERQTTPNITQNFMLCDDSQKFHALMQALKADVEYGLTLIFVEKKREADMLEERLSSIQGMDIGGVAALHGDKDQAAREYALKSFRRGEVRVLVATNVAARGLDIPKVNHVIIYGMPNNIDDYIHRIGRTGRVGNKGVATSLVSRHDTMLFPRLVRLLKSTGAPIPEWMVDTSKMNEHVFQPPPASESNWSFSGRGRDRFGPSDAPRRPGWGGISSSSFGSRRDESTGERGGFRSEGSWGGGNEDKQGWGGNSERGGGNFERSGGNFERGGGNFERGGNSGFGRGGGGSWGGGNSERGGDRSESGGFGRGGGWGGNSERGGGESNGFGRSHSGGSWGANSERGGERGERGDRGGFGRGGGGGWGGNSERGQSNGFGGGNRNGNSSSGGGGSWGGNSNGATSSGSSWGSNSNGAASSGSSWGANSNSVTSSGSSWGGSGSASGSGGNSWGQNSNSESSNGGNSRTENPSPGGWGGNTGTESAGNLKSWGSSSSSAGPASSAGSWNNSATPAASGNTSWNSSATPASSSGTCWNSSGPSPSSSSSWNSSATPAPSSNASWNSTSAARSSPSPSPSSSSSWNTPAASSSTSWNSSATPAPSSGSSWNTSATTPASSSGTSWNSSAPSPSSASSWNSSAAPTSPSLSSSSSTPASGNSWNSSSTAASNSSWNSSAAPTSSSSSTNSSWNSKPASPSPSPSPSSSSWNSTPTPSSSWNTKPASPSPSPSAPSTPSSSWNTKPASPSASSSSWNSTPATPSSSNTSWNTKPASPSLSSSASSWNSTPSTPSWNSSSASAFSAPNNSAQSENGENRNENNDN